jgi:osmotically-inducible protein OsmY
MYVNPLKRIGAILIVSLGLGMVAAGCQSTATSRSTGETMDDASLTAKVKTEIAKEQGLGDALAINVDTYRQVVSLSGFVNNQDQAQKAADCARRVPGVREVKNNLQTKPKS